MKPLFASATRRHASACATDSLKDNFPNGQTLYPFSALPKCLLHLSVGQ
jgi:hypothetical protein